MSHCVEAVTTSMRGHTKFCCFISIILIQLYYALL